MFIKMMANLTTCSFLAALFLGALVQDTIALAICGTDKYWQDSTETCERCGILCDPPNVYQTDCPKFCPDYHPSPVPPEPSPTPGHGEGKTVWVVVYITSAIAGICSIVAIVYFRKKCFKKLNSYYNARVLKKKDDQFPTQEVCADPNLHQSVACLTDDPGEDE